MKIELDINERYAIFCASSEKITALEKLIKLQEEVYPDKRLLRLCQKDIEVYKQIIKKMGF